MRRMTWRVVNGSLRSTVTMAGASSPQDHHWASEARSAVRQLPPDEIVGRAKMRPTRVQMRVASSVR